MATKFAFKLGSIATFMEAGLIVLVTIANIILNFAAEPLWPKLTVVLVLTPATVLGNWLSITWKQA